MNRFDAGRVAPASRSIMFNRLRGTLVAAALFGSISARAEIRFGNNAFIGGHNVFNQTFNSQRRGLYVVHEGKPAHEGCLWRADGVGSQTKGCHLQRKRWFDLRFAEAVAARSSEHEACVLAALLGLLGLRSGPPPQPSPAQ